MSWILSILYYMSLLAVLVLSLAAAFPEAAVRHAFACVTMLLQAHFTPSPADAETETCVAQRARKRVRASHAAVDLLARLPPGAYELNLLSDDPLSQAVLWPPGMFAAAVVTCKFDLVPNLFPGFHMMSVDIFRGYVLWLEVIQPRIKSHATLRWACELIRAAGLWIQWPYLLQPNGSPAHINDAFSYWKALPPSPSPLPPSTLPRVSQLE